MSEGNYYQRLKEKVQIYEKLAKTGAGGDDGDKYAVDFEQKAWDSEEVSIRNNELVSSDMMTFKERQRWEAEAKKLLIEEGDGREENENRKRVLAEIEKETEEGRERAKKVKSERESAVQKRLAALKKRKAQKGK
mmetsp:Transcript_23224/g.58874  ORF Transcript_23224/g.58874 Transcript_23224/m.58874 type:complete len:135 (+) Transcript_23224:220-624(+)